MPKHREVPAQVANLQDLCADLLERGIRVEGKLHWNHRVSDLKGNYGRDTQKYSTARSLLVKAGVLEKVTVGLNSTLSKTFPPQLVTQSPPRYPGDESYDRVAYLYIVRDEKKVKQLSTSVAAAAKFVGQRPEDVMLSYSRALARVKREFDNHPEPTKLFFSIVRHLLPSGK
ncbi:MAG: hypothetical protein NUV78_01675 [Candidatus Zambryskibacteria bacterium]|nr:hypothetical protein [Candidatus Zambryskibacteria bacterium]